MVKHLGWTFENTGPVRKEVLKKNNTFESYHFFVGMQALYAVMDIFAIDHCS